MITNRAQSGAVFVDFLTGSNGYNPPITAARLAYFIIISH
jgi:hypothetical protein